MDQKDFNKQVNNEQVKQQLFSYLLSNLVQIYNVCSDQCLKKYDSDTLMDREKICLSKCFDRKSESFNITMNILNEFGQKGSKDDKNSKTKIIDGTEIIYE